MGRSPASRWLTGWDGHLSGAAARTAPAATAFAHRADQYDMLILSQWADPAESERNIAWTRETFAAMEPHLAHAVYVNNLGEEGQTRVQAAYGANYERLAEVKRGYDPDNALRWPAGWDPTSLAAAGHPFRGQGRHDGGVLPVGGRGWRR